MSGKDPGGQQPPVAGASGAVQAAPVDLATKTPTVAQIRIPSVPATLRPTLVGSRSTGPNQHLKPQIGPGSPRTTTPLVKAPTGASITMIPGPGKVTVVPASVSQIITPRTTTNTGIRQNLSTRPILAQPAPSRPSTISSQPRAAVATPILRGVTPVSAGTHALTLRAPIQQNIAGSIRLASPQVQWVQTTPSTTTQPGTIAPRASTQTTRPLNTTRPPTVLPVGSRVTMAAVSFRPTGPLVTQQTRPPITSPTAAAVSLIQTGTKTIVSQNPAGIFKPITTQVSVPGQPVALRPNVSNTIPVRVPAGQRVSMVSGTPVAVSLTPTPTHIQVPIVPGAVGPPKARVAVPTQSIQKLVSGNVTNISMGMIGQVSVAPVQLSQSQTTGARTIQLPYSGQQSKTGAPPSTSIPVARVIPQPSVSRDQQAIAISSGYVVAGAFLPASRPMDTSTQSGPVNLSVSDRSAFSRGAVAPAMTLPNFTQTTFLYEAGRADQSSVTITTLPAPSETSGQSTASQHHGPATITPARITPIIPPGQGASSQTEQEKTVPGSPRPSILRKRPEGDITPVKGTQLLTSPGSPPRPDSSGSSTISATSSLPALSGDEQPPPTPTPTIEPSPRKKPRKQQLPPRETTTNISPEWAAVKRELGVRDRLEWNRSGPEPDWEGRVRNWNNDMWQGGSVKSESGWDQDMNQDQADDEDEMSSDEEKEKQPNFIQGKPHMSLLNSYRHTWKSRHNHFLRYSDVKSKDERRPTVNELANQKFVLQKINGWKIYHLSASMEDIVDMESELSKRLQEIGRRLEESANKDVAKELVKVQELIKANIQRSKVIQDQVSEAKENSQSIFEHKPKIQDIIVKYQSKRSLKGRREN